MRLAALAALSVVVLAGCNKPEFIEIEPKEFNFRLKGEKVWARIIAKNQTGHTFPGVKASWSSSDPKVVAVEEDGHVVSVGPGHATITAKAGDMKAEAMAEVLTVEKVAVEPASLELDMASGSKTVVVKAFDVEGHELKDRKPMARCDNEKVCTATDTSVFPSNPGTAKLIVSVEGQKVEVPVTVTEKAPKKK